MSPLHVVGEFIRQGLLQIPMGLVRGLFVGSLAIVLVWVLRLPKQITEPESGAQHWDENLKIGASLALVLQILIYLVS